MSYGIIRIQKFNRAGVKGIEIHDQRERSVSHSNEDIDFTKSENNYDLKNDKNINYLEKIDEKIGGLDLKKAVRKDAIVMCQCFVTSDNEYFQRIGKEKQEEYFEKSLEFIEKKYGKENIISATVHLDEKTPHMHVNFVPITQDNRLSAKDLFKRDDLIKLHDEFYKEVGKEFGLERGKSTEFVKHLETKDFKLKTKIQEFEKTKEKFLKVEKTTLDLDSLKEQTYDQELGGFFKKPTGNYIVSEKTLIELRTLAEQGILLRDENKELKEINARNLERIERLEKQNVDYPELQRKNRNLYKAFDRTIENYLRENNPNIDPKGLEKVEAFLENAVKSALYTMRDEERKDFCNKITCNNINGWDLKKPIERAYKTYTNKIKENSRGFER